MTDASKRLFHKDDVEVDAEFVEFFVIKAIEAFNEALILDAFESL